MSNMELSTATSQPTVRLLRKADIHRKQII